MAKVSGPLMSLTASGSVAKTLTYAAWKGVQYVRNLVIPSNPRTAGQMEARAKLGAAGRFNSKIEFESELDEYLRGVAPSGQSGVSYFASQQIANFSQSETDYNDGGNTTEKGYFDAAAGTAGIGSVTIPGETPTVVPGGLILWNAYQSAFALSDTLAPTAAVDASEANITTFLGNITA